MARGVLLGGLAAWGLGLGLAQAQPAPAALKLMSATFASTDLGRSLAFYTKGLGLTAAGRIEHDSVSEIPLVFPGGGASLLLIKAKGAATALPEPPRVGRVILVVPDLRALAAQLAAAGYPLRRPVAEQAQHHVMIGLAADPDGNELELVQRIP